MKIFLIRHAESEGNVQHIMQGHVDYPLSQRGVTQSQILARYMAEQFAEDLPAEIYASPLLRTRQTADALVEAIDREYVLIDDLKEVDSGIFSGLNWEQAGEKYPEERAVFKAARDWGAVPGGESREQLWQRIQGVLNQLMAKHKESDTVWVVTHGGVIRAWVSLVAGISASENVFVCIDNTALTLVGIQGDRRYIRYVNKTDHLTCDQFQAEGAPM